MRIGISTNTFDLNGYGRFGEKTYEKLKEHGFSATDFGMMNTEAEFYSSDLKKVDALLNKEKELADRAGIEIYQAHGPWRCPPQDFTEEDRKERLDKMKRSIRAAHILGVKNWVIHPLMPYGTSDKNGPNESLTFKVNVEFLKILSDTAGEYGITVCLENMPFTEFSISTPEKILETVDRVAADNVRICLDTGHANVFNLNVAEEVRKIKDKLQVLHVHDNNFGIDSHLFPYFGTVKWKEFGKALKDINFNGVFSLETEPPSSLSDELFEKTGKFLCDLAKSIVK